MVRLEEICTINMGQSPESSSYNELEEGLPFFQGNADFGEVSPTVRVWCNSPTKIANEGDILLSVRAPIGALNIADRTCCIGRGLAALTADESKCSRRFLWHALSSKVEELNSKGTGSTFKAIGKKVLFETEIPLPTHSEQAEIIRKLDTVDNLLTWRKRQLSKLDQLVKARFVEMFGDPVRNEKGWPIVHLEELAEIRIGPFGSLLHKEDYIEGGHALINPSHIVEGKICADEKLTVSYDKYKELSAYHLKIDDIVLGRRGEMGRCAVVHTEGLLCGTGSMIVRPNNKMKPYFLQTILSSPTYKMVIEDKAVGVTMMNLNVPIVSALPVPLLPLDLQEKFIALLQKVDKSKTEVKQSLEKLETLKKSLMQEYFG